MSITLDRDDRLKVLEKLISRAKSADQAIDATQLLDRVERHYANRAAGLAYAEGKAGRRAIQRDLEKLVEDGVIELANPAGKPLRYWRPDDAARGIEQVTRYAERMLGPLLEGMLSRRILDPIWDRLRDKEEDLALGADKLAILSDSLRLIPAEIKREVFVQTLCALAESRTLKVGYRDAQQKVTHPTLHPQAMMQRGARVYLFAIKNDETFVRTYALHRMTSAKAGNEAARRDEGFRLEDRIKQGHADFGSGEMIELELLAAGYVADLLRDCPLSKGQREEDEPEGSGFDLRITATVPETGQLYRWLLGCGDKVKVLAPEKLRRAIAAQARKTAKLYTI